VTRYGIGRSRTTTNSRVMDPRFYNCLTVQYLTRDRPNLINELESAGLRGRGDGDQPGGLAIIIPIFWPGLIQIQVGDFRASLERSAKNSQKIRLAREMPGWCGIPLLPFLLKGRLESNPSTSPKQYKFETFLPVSQNF